MGPNRVTLTHLRVPVRYDVISALPQRPLLAVSSPYMLQTELAVIELSNDKLFF